MLKVGDIFIENNDDAGVLVLITDIKHSDCFAKYRDISCYAEPCSVSLLRDNIIEYDGCLEMIEMLIVDNDWQKVG